MTVTRDELKEKLRKIFNFPKAGSSWQHFMQYGLNPWARCMEQYMDALPESQDSQSGVVPDFYFPENGLGEDYYAAFTSVDPYKDVSGNSNNPDAYNDNGMEKRLPYLGRFPVKGNNQQLQTENASLIQRAFGDFVFDTYIMGLQQQLNAGQRQGTLFGVFDKTDGTNASRDVSLLIDGQDLKIHTGQGFVGLPTGSIKILANTATNHPGFALTLSVKEKLGDPTKEVFKLIVNNCLLINTEAPKRSIARSASMIANPRITFGTNCVQVFARLHSGNENVFGIDGQWQRSAGPQMYNGTTPLDLTS